MRTVPQPALDEPKRKLNGQTAVLLSCAVPATFLFLYLHEWGHSAGYWLQGQRPCVSLNNAWSAVEPETLFLLGGLFGPLFTLVISVSFLVIHLTCVRFRAVTFLVSAVNAVAHPIWVPLFILGVATGTWGPNIDVDEAILAAMLPEMEVSKAIVESNVGTLDAGFLFRLWSLPTLWLYFIIHVFIWWLLLLRSKPIAGTGNFRVALSAVVLSTLVAGGYAWLAPFVGWRVCFS